MFFFFQAEDGIRDLYVTGVQTCALPIDRKSTRLNSSQAEDGIRDLYVTGVQTCALPISTRLNSSHVEISYAVFCLTGVQTCARSEEHTSELQSRRDLVCRLLLETKQRRKNVPWKRFLKWGLDERESITMTGHAQGNQQFRNARGGIFFKIKATQQHALFP